MIITFGVRLEKTPIEEGTVWHVLVFTRKNRRYSNFKQFRYDDISISNGHGCMVRATGEAEPCLILRVEFDTT